MYGSGFLPTDEVNIYRTDADQLYLVGTAEVSLAALRMGEILDEGALPLRYAGYSTCFRREAGTYGKDMGGMFRVHQFDKVEMFSFCHPQSSWDELEYLCGGRRGDHRQPRGPIPSGEHRCRATSGAAAAKKYDIEAWLPGQQRYREITSCSNYTDYGARRAQTRMRRATGNSASLTRLNGTATAMGRTLIALLENHQQADGSVAVAREAASVPAGVRTGAAPTVGGLAPFRQFGSGASASSGASTSSSARACPAVTWVVRSTDMPCHDALPDASSTRLPKLWIQRISPSRRITRYS